MVIRTADRSTAPPRAPVRRLWLAVLGGYTAFGATLQVLPTYVADRFHGGPLMAGTTVGVAFLATACARPFAGRLADAGHARPVVATGGVLSALGGAGHLLAPDPATLMCARLLMGAGEAALFAGALPWVMTDVPTHRRGRVAGWFGLSMWAGLAGGPALGSVLSHHHGFRLVWWAVIALAVVSAAIELTTAPGRSTDTTNVAMPSGLRDVLPAGVSLPGLVLGLAAYGYGTVNALLVLHLHRDGIGGDHTALPTFAAAFLLTRTVGSPLTDRAPAAMVAAGSVTVEAAGLALLATAHSAPAALVGTAVTGAGVALMYPATVALTLRRTGHQGAGAAVGVMTSFWDLGLMAAGPLGGVLAAHLGYGTAFAAAAVVATLAPALALLLHAGVATPPRSPVTPVTTPSEQPR